MASNNGEQAAYGRFRRSAAAVILGFIGMLVVADVLNREYRLDPITLGLLVGTLLVLLGVEVGQRLLR